MSKIKTLTPEQESQMQVFRDKYIDNFKSCKKPEKRKIKKGVDMIYKLAGFKSPKIIYVKSPLGAQLLANILKIKNIRDSVGDSVRDSVRDSVGDSVWDSVRDSVRASVWDSVWDSVRDSVWASVWDSVGDSVWASVRDSVLDSVWDSVGDSVRASVWDSVMASVGASVRDSVWDSVGASVMASVRDSVGASVRATKLTYEYFSSYGNISDYGWVAYFDYFDSIGIDIGKNKEQFYTFRDMILGGVYDMIQFENYCIVVELQESFIQNSSKRLHNEKGPAIKFKDGYELYRLNGMKVESKEEFDKIVNDKYSVQELLSIENNDTRAVAYEYFNKEKFANEPHKVLDSQIDGKGNEMKVVEFENKDIGRFYIGICPSTHKTHYLATKESTCVKAKCASFGFSEEINFIQEY